MSFFRKKSEPDFDTLLEESRATLEAAQQSAIAKSEAASKSADNADILKSSSSSASVTQKIAKGVAKELREYYIGRTDTKKNKAGGIVPIIGAILTYQEADKSRDHIYPLTTLQKALDDMLEAKTVGKEVLGTKAMAAFNDLKRLVDTRVATHAHLTATIEQIKPTIDALQEAQFKLSLDGKGDSIASKKKSTTYQAKIDFLNELQDALTLVGTASPARVIEAAEIITAAKEKAITDNQISDKGTGNVAKLLDTLSTAVAEEQKHVAGIPQHHRSPSPSP